MPLVINAGPNNLLPSRVGDTVIHPTAATWFEGALVVNFEGLIPAAVMLDFASDKNYLFTTILSYSSGYVTTGYVSSGYVASLSYLANTQYVDHEYVTPEYVTE